eukprot:scaffold6300_cov154-Chaetoceros_neogracile.AAC.1
MTLLCNRYCFTRYHTAASEDDDDDDDDDDSDTSNERCRTPTTDDRLPIGEFLMTSSSLLSPFISVASRYGR